MTALEVLDSAVKIGLGALIAGASALLLARGQHGREIEKERIRREREILEEVAEGVETFTSKALRYWALISEHMTYKRRGEHLPEARAALLNAAKDELFDSFHAITNAEARLLLLGLREVQESLRGYGDIVRDLRANLHDKAKAATEDEIAGWRSKLLRAREHFFEFLSGAYRQLGRN